MISSFEYTGCVPFLRGLAIRQPGFDAESVQRTGPGPLRAAYERITQSEQTAAKGGRLFHDPQRTLDLAKRMQMQMQAVTTARQYRRMVPR